MIVYMIVRAVTELCIYQYYQLRTLGYVEPRLDTGLRKFATLTACLRYVLTCRLHQCNPARTLRELHCKAHCTLFEYSAASTNARMLL